MRILTSLGNLVRKCCYSNKLCEKLQYERRHYKQHVQLLDTQCWDCPWGKSCSIFGILLWLSPCSFPDNGNNGSLTSIVSIVETSWPDFVQVPFPVQLRLRNNSNRRSWRKPDQARNPYGQPKSEIDLRILTMRLTYMFHRSIQELTS